MKYLAKISVKGDASLIKKVFSSEDAKIKEKASYEIKKVRDLTIFNITADDSVSLRAILNSITKIFTVIEKTQGI
jgi:tRNA threonylcarbamoyladenosine modification (KEOPS) complex  Pcc1 subunit